MAFGSMTRRHLVTYASAGMGAMTGAVTGAMLTLISYALVGIPHIPKTEYFIYSATAYAILGAVIAPVSVLLSLRRVPLWRAFAEPALAGSLAVAATFSVGGLLARTLPAGAILASV